VPNWWDAIRPVPPQAFMDKRTQTRDSGAGAVGGTGIVQRTNLKGIDGQLSSVCGRRKRRGAFAVLTGFGPKQ